MPEDAISRLPDLMEAFEFTAEDLDYNRRGLISPEQHLRISPRAKSRFQLRLTQINQADRLGLYPENLSSGLFSGVIFSKFA